MPLFLCPCCGTSSCIPLASCEWLLDERRNNWHGGGEGGDVVPAKCVDCMLDPKVGEAVTLRGGRGLSATGDERDLPAGDAATVEGVWTWEGDGTIYLVRLSTGEALYASRARLATRPRPPSTARSRGGPDRGTPCVGPGGTRDHRGRPDVRRPIPGLGPAPAGIRRALPMRREPPATGLELAPPGDVPRGSSGGSTKGRSACLFVASLAIGIGSIVAAGYVISTRMAGAIESR